MSDPWRANAIFLRRAQTLILEPGTGEVPLAHVAAVLKNLEALGYTCSPPLIERLRRQSEGELTELYRQLTQTLRELVGAEVAFEPMYPNFPHQVMEASEGELFLNAILHYTGDLLGLRLLPEYAKAERPPLADQLDLRVLRLGTPDELRALGSRLIGANSSISATDKEDVAWFVHAHHEDLLALLPPEIPHKENLAYVTGLLLDHPVGADVLLTRYFKTATDVLRLATALSEGDVSLAEKTRFRSFKRAERRTLLALLERVPAPREDMLRHRGRWIRLGERLHPGEHAARFPKSAEAFAAVRRGDRVETFRSKVEAALRAGDAAGATALLRTHPGELARRLDQLLRIAAEPDDIVEAFVEVAGRVSTPVLLQLLAHFAGRPEPGPIRAFFPKGNAARVFSIPHALPPIPAERCARLVGACREALVDRFREREPLGKVYVDPGLAAYLVPFSQRSASRALRTLVRGSRVPLPAGDTIRFFLWWKEGKLNGKATGRVDIDLSAVLYDGEWRYREHISYTNLRSAKYRAAHSGDITSAPRGACEFIDLDIPSVVAHGGRYVAMSVLSFTRQPFSELPQCFAGWMARQDPGSGEVFEPATVVDRLDLAGDKRVSVPAILDLEERCLIWTDLYLSSRPNFATNIESNQRGLVHSARAIATLVKPNLQQLFELHALARGELVDDPAEAERVFSPAEGTPFALEEILADYL